MEWDSFVSKQLEAPSQPDANPFFGIFLLLLRLLSTDFELRRILTYIRRPS